MNLLQTKKDLVCPSLSDDASIIFSPHASTHLFFLLWVQIVGRNKLNPCKVDNDDWWKKFNSKMLRYLNILNKCFESKLLTHNTYFLNWVQLFWGYSGGSLNFCILINMAMEDMYTLNANLSMCPSTDFNWKNKMGCKNTIYFAQNY